MTDTDVANPKISMPANEDLAVQTIQHLIAEPYNSSVMKLPRPVLNELARRLLEPGVETAKVIEWLHTKKADLPERNVYRFAQRFREVFKIVWAGWADKMILAELSADPDFDTASYQRVIKHRVHHIIAQELMTSAPEDLDTARINMALSAVMAHDKGELEREKLLIAQGQAEHRAAKAEAETEKIKQGVALEKEQIKDRVKGLQTRIDELQKHPRAASRSRSLSSIRSAKN